MRKKIDTLEKQLEELGTPHSVSSPQRTVPKLPALPPISTIRSLGADTDALAVHPGAPLLALAIGSTIRVYSLETFRLEASLLGHMDNVSGLAFFSSDPDTLFSADVGGAVKVWSLKQKRSTQTIRVSKRALRALAIVPNPSDADAPLLAVAAEHESVKLVNPLSSAVVRTIGDIGGDVTLIEPLPFGQFGLWVYSDAAATLALFRGEDWAEPIWKQNALGSPVDRIAVPADSDLHSAISFLRAFGLVDVKAHANRKEVFELAAETCCVACRDHTIRIFHSSSMLPVREIPTAYRWLVDVCFHPESMGLVLSAGEEGEVTVHDILKPETPEVKKLLVPSSEHADFLTALRCSACGFGVPRFVAIGDNGIHVLGPTH